MIFKPGPMIAEASGKIGGQVFARNRGGMYVRNWANPVNPQTSRQTAVRDYLAEIMVGWRALPQANRDAWDLYAANTPVYNRLGEQIYLTGFQMAVRYYVLIKQVQAAGSGAGAALSGSTTFGLEPVPTGIVATLSEAAGLSLAYTNTDEWANDDDGFIAVYLGRPRGATRNFFKGPYRFCGYVDGDSAVPPTSPLVVAAANLPFTVTEGQRCTVAVRAAGGDGRVSVQVFDDVIVAA